MPISDIPILSMLRERMEWHQERQHVLAENVANADTSNFQAKDLAPPDFERQLSAASVSLARESSFAVMLQPLQERAGSPSSCAG